MARERVQQLFGEMTERARLIEANAQDPESPTVVGYIVMLQRELPELKARLEELEREIWDS